MSLVVISNVVILNVGIKRADCIIFCITEALIFHLQEYASICIIFTSVINLCFRNLSFISLSQERRTLDWFALNFSDILVL